MIPLVKICSKKIDISRSISRINPLKREISLSLKAIPAKKFHLCVKNYLASLIMRRHEMNMSHHFPCELLKFSQLKSFNIKFASRVSENCFLKLKKKQVVKLTR